jgi:hypothetical protein
MSLVYVALLDEGTDVWRPVEATNLGGGLYRIAGAWPYSDEERWAFPPGSIVRCSERMSQDGRSMLVAVERADT